MMLNDRATFQRFLDNDPDFVRKNYKNYMSLDDEFNTTNATIRHSCSYDPGNRLTTPIVRGDFSTTKASITDTAIHMINCSRDRAVRMQVEADRSIGDVAFVTGTENHPSTIQAVVRTKREKCKIRNMISAMAESDLLDMFDTYGINRLDAMNIFKTKMNVVKLENNLGYNLEYSRGNGGVDTPNLCSLKEDMDYIASKQPIAMGSPPLTGGEVNHWKRRAIYKSECEYNPMHITKHAEACFGAGMQLIASGVGIPKGMQAYPSPHNTQPRAMVQSVMAAKGPATMESTNTQAFTTCGPSVCPPCATTTASTAAQAATRASSLTNEVLETFKLFDLVSFLEQPDQSRAPVIFGDPDYNADRGEEANFRTMSFPKSLFRTQQIECSSQEKGLDFPDIHANIISNQFNTFGKMKFFGHKVLGWDYNMDAPNPGNACNRGEHVITATSDQVSSIKLRYVRRFFYVYYGLLIKEIGSVKSELLKNAMRYKTMAIKSKSINNPEEIEELYQEMDAAGRFASIAETFFDYAVPYHLINLGLLNSRLIDMGGAGVDNKLFTVIVAQRESYWEEVDKQGDRMVKLEDAARRGQQPDYAIGVGSNDYGDGGGGELPSVGGALNAFPSPPSEAETQQFKTLAKAVIVTLIRDQAPPQMLFEMAFGMDYVSTREELGWELGIDWNVSTKWSVIIQAFMNSWDADGAGRDKPSTTWIKNQIMTWSGYILRHMAEEEEWIISKMGELLTGKYSNSEGVIMASQFLTILGKSVGLTRAQAVQDVQEASGIVTDLEGNTAALHLQIASLQAQKQGLIEREAEAIRWVEEMVGGTAGEGYDTLQKISTSWTNFMTSVGGDIPEPPFEDGGISSEIDYVKTKLVQKHDEMDRLDELVTTMEADLVTARANLVTAQSNVTRIDADLVTANADLVTANADLATANADNADLTNNADVCVAEANARDLLSGQITALEGTIETQSETLKTRLDKINELEAGTAEVGDVAADAAAATRLMREADLYKDKLKKAKETSEAAIKQKNMIIIGLAVFILILIIVVVVK